MYWQFVCLTYIIYKSVHHFLVLYTWFCIFFFFFLNQWFCVSERLNRWIQDRKDGHNYPFLSSSSVNPHITAYQLCSTLVLNLGLVCTCCCIMFCCRINCLNRNWWKLVIELCSQEIAWRYFLTSGINVFHSKIVY